MELLCRWIFRQLTNPLTYTVPLLILTLLFFVVVFPFTIDWEMEMVSKAEILRLIYQGRFLHCNVTLGALGLPLGKTTVMHLVPRDNLPEPNSQGGYQLEFN